MYESLVTGVPDFPMMRISATCPINERSSFRREIADRDSVEQDLYAFENSDSPISDSAESPDTVVYPFTTQVHANLSAYHSLHGFKNKCI
jgi:hypothetical protein